MKKLTKILSFVAPIVTVAGVAPVITLTGCSNSTSNSISYTGEKKITTNVADVELTFTLAKELSSGQVLYAEVAIKGGSYLVKTPKLSPQGKTVKVTLTTLATPPTSGKLDINFVCYSDSTKLNKVWNTKITDFEISYSK